MVLSIQCTEDPAFPPLYKRDNPTTSVSSLSFSLLPADDCLVDTRLCSEAEPGDEFVPETEQSLASPAVGVGEQIAKEREGVARLGQASNRRSQDDGRP